MTGGNIRNIALNAAFLAAEAGTPVRHGESARGRQARGAEDRASALGRGNAGVGMSRIRLTIDRLVLNGFQARRGQGVDQALQSQLSQVLADRGDAARVGASASHAGAEAGPHAAGSRHQRRQQVRKADGPRRGTRAEAVSYARLRPGESEAPAANRRAASAPPRASHLTEANPTGERVTSEAGPGESAKQHWSIGEVNMAAPSHRETAGPAPVDAPPLVQQVLHSSGQPLDEATRDFFEPKFGHDLGNVRLHTGSQAAKSAQAVNASAYTMGSDVVFGAESGPHQKPLLAHELAHVVQQGHASGNTPAAEGSALEGEAERASAAITGGSKSAAVRASSAPRILRQAVPATPAQSPALSFLNAQDITKLQGFGNADYQASLDTLDKMLRITGDVTQDGLPRQYVSTRQASGELRTFLDFVRNPDVQALKVVPSASGGRSPDFYYRHASGAEARVEVVNITAAAKPARAMLDPGSGARNIPRQGGSVVTQVEDIDTVAKLREAIRVKIRAGGQLNAQNPNTQAGGQPMQVGGEVRVSTSHVELSRAEIDGVVRDLQSDLANSSADKIVVDTVDSAEPRAGRKLFEYSRNPDGTFSYSGTRVSHARQPGASTSTPAATDSPSASGEAEAIEPGTPAAPAKAVDAPAAGAKPSGTGAASDKSAAQAVTEASGEGAVPDAVVEGAARSGVAEGAVGGAVEAEAVGVAARVAGFALETAAGLVIGIVVGLFLEWLKGVVEEALLKGDLEALEPSIQAKLQELTPEINQLEKRNSKVYSRVTIDVTRKVGTAISGEGGFTGFGSWDHYEGAKLLGVSVAGEAAPNQRSETSERLSPNEDRKHSVGTFSALIDDPPKRKREAESKKAAEALSRAKPSQPVPPPPKAPAAEAPAPFTPLHEPAPPSAPSVQLLAPPGGAAQEPRVEEVVAYYKGRALNLKARGERIHSASSPSADEMKAFLNDEAIWRNESTIWNNHYIDKGPSDGHTGMDELLHSWEYGERLQQLATEARNRLGG